MGRPADTDDHLVARANDGDTAALATLLDRHLHPAWRVALAASPDATAAQAAVVAGFCDAVAAAARHPEPLLSLRTRIAAAVHRAAAADGRVRRATAPPAPDPVLAAFATLPTSSRTALWLTRVEGGTAAQIAPVLGLDRNATAALVDRASTAFRARLAADGAQAAGDAACARTFARLPDEAAGRLTEAERDEVSQHVAACASCATWLAAIVAPRPALRRLVVPVPDSLPLAVAERWAAVAGRDRTVRYRGLSERAVGAAAAAVLAIGLAGAAFLGRDDDNDRPELAAPTGSTPSGGPAADVDLSDPVLPDAPAATTSVASTALGRGSGDAGGDSARGDGDKLPPKTQAPTPTPAAPPAAPPAATPPASDGGAGALPPAISDPVTDTQVTAEVPDVLVVGIGDDTGIAVAGEPVGDPPPAEKEPAVVVDLPLLDPIALP